MALADDLPKFGQATGNALRSAYTTVATPLQQPLTSLARGAAGFGQGLYAGFAPATANAASMRPTNYGDGTPIPGTAGDADRQGNYQQLQLSAPSAPQYGPFQSPQYGNEGRGGPTAPVLANAAQPGSSVQDVGNGVVRRGNTYSNLGLPGLNDVDNMRAPLPSTAGFLQGVKPFGAGGAGGAAPQYQYSYGLSGQVFRDPVQGNAGGGASLVDNYAQRANELLGSNSLVDNWRGRQLMRARERLIQGSAQTAQAQAALMHGQASLTGADAQTLHAANEMPIAQMHNATALRGQDAAFAPHAGQAAAANLAYKYIAAGNPEMARHVMEPFIPRPFPVGPAGGGTKVQPDGTGGYIVTGMDGVERHKSAQQVQQEDQAQQRDATAQSLGLVKPGR